ncbi:putative OB-fold protein [Leucobacter exalbidus]|uniref:OB-fold protein n=1 Tax=Leucobacter exalbidus TaxID=662960 RepID=A0A940PQ53_9MICO|nr:zinc ribbon domain-containing protein [Leucobacter exalbidus]MBP1327278.1 putative OB-fold protein [Leucobacter exalbidus]
MATFRPIPVPDEASQSYWEGATRNALVLPRCSGCAQFHFPPLLHCPHCGSGELDSVEVNGAGTVYSFTTLNTPPGPAFIDLVPLTVGVIELDVQPMLLITANMFAGKSTKIQIGAHAEIFFTTIAEDVSIPQIQVGEV